MCLKVVTKQYNPPERIRNNTNIGYKVLWDINDGTFAPFYRPAIKLPDETIHKWNFPINKWIYNKLSYDKFSYPSRTKYILGFHIFKHKEAAEDFMTGEVCAVLAKVKYQRITAEGIDCWGRSFNQVIVAQSMKILEILS